MDDPNATDAVSTKTEKPVKKAAKKTSKNTRRLQLYFDEDVRMDLEHHCIEKKKTMSEYVNALVKKHVPKWER